MANEQVGLKYLRTIFIVGALVIVGVAVLTLGDIWQWHLLIILGALLNGAAVLVSAITLFWDFPHLIHHLMEKGRLFIQKLDLVQIITIWICSFVWIVSAILANNSGNLDFIGLAIGVTLPAIAYAWFRPTGKDYGNLAKITLTGINSIGSKAQRIWKSVKQEWHQGVSQASIETPEVETVIPNFGEIQPVEITARQLVWRLPGGIKKRVRKMLEQQHPNISIVIRIIYIGIVGYVGYISSTMLTGVIDIDEINPKLGSLTQVLPFLLVVMLAGWFYFSINHNSPLLQSGEVVIKQTYPHWIGSIAETRKVKMPKNRFLAYLFTCVGILITMAGLGSTALYHDWSSWSLALVPGWIRYTLFATLALTLVWVYIFKSKLEIPVALLSITGISILVSSVPQLDTPFSVVSIYIWAFISLVQIIELTWGFVRRYQSIWIPVVDLVYLAALSGWSLILLPILWDFMPREVMIGWLAMWSTYQILFYFVYWRNAPSIITNKRFIVGTPELTLLGFITTYHDARISEMTIGETQKYIPVGIKYDRNTRQFRLVWAVRWNPGSVFTNREQVDMRWIRDTFVEDVQMGGRRAIP